MIRVLPSFFEHFQVNKKSLITKIYGIYTVQMDDFEPINVMIQANSLPAMPNYEMNYCFDMKGSTVNREVLKKVSLNDLKYGPPTGGQVLKDLDYIRLNDVKHFMNIDASERKELCNILSIDVKFLQNMRNMDYSLLMGVKRRKQR